MFEFLGEVATGGLLGFAGTVFGRVAGYYERKQQHKQNMELRAHEREMEELRAARRVKEREHEKTLVRLQMERDRQDAEQELAIIDKRGSWAGLAASYKHDTETGETSIWVNNTLRLVRPSLTVGLWVFNMIVFLIMQKADVVTPQIEATMSAGITAAMVATVWWFGDRSRPVPKREVPDVQQAG